MKLDPEERILLTAEDIERIQEIYDNPPTLTEHMLAAIKRYKEEQMKRKPNKPRDPHAVAMFKRKSGSHGKTKKALRRADKIALRREHGPVAQW